MGKERCVERPGHGPFAVCAETMKRRNVYRACARDSRSSDKYKSSRPGRKECVLNAVGTTSAVMAKRVATAGESFPNIHRETPLLHISRATLLLGYPRVFESVQCVTLA